MRTYSSNYTQVKCKNSSLAVPGRDHGFAMLRLQLIILFSSKLKSVSRLANVKPPLKPMEIAKSPRSRYGAPAASRLSAACSSLLRSSLCCVRLARLQRRQSVPAPPPPFTSTVVCPETPRPVPGIKTAPRTRLHSFYLHEETTSGQLFAPRLAQEKLLRRHR